MSIKIKALLINVIGTIIITISTCLILHSITLSYINKLENRDVSNSFEILNSILNKEEAGLQSTSLDWSHWDDSYNFLINKNDGYIKDNLIGDTLSQLNLNFMIYTDAGGKVYYDNTLKLTDSDKDLIESKLFNKDDKSHSLTSFKSNDEIKCGILFISGKLFLITAAPITTSDEKAESDGSLIIGRYIDDKFLDYIRSVSKNDFNFKANTDPNNFGNTLDISRDNDYIKANKVLKDIFGGNSVVVSVSIERSAYNMGKYYLKLLLIIFIIALIIIRITDNFILDRLILKRLNKLYEFIKSVGETRNMGARIYLRGNDELNRIANSINNMLSQLDSANKEINEMDERFRLIMEATNDGYLDFYVKTKELYMSQEWKNIIGCRNSNGTELYQSYIAKLLPESFEKMKIRYLDIINGKCEYFNEEYELANESGEVIWVHQRGKVVGKDEKGESIRIISTLTNITERKKYEEEILFLSFSDNLTGLKNRAYMERVFEKLDNNEESSYFILMGDVNGLKLTNDALGHKEGDKLIYIVGCILKEACDKDDIISRWGGDEFIVLIMNKDRDYVTCTIDKIRKALESVTEFHFKISIALGYAEKDEEARDTEAVMSLAEKRMYRNKLVESKSTRSSTISSLIRTLYEKHSETEEHTLRIKNLSLKLGKKLGLLQDELDELELLALLHDIGKIGIPEQVLMKPSELTKEEWCLMKTHTDIGYRIAKSTPELSHIAHEILSHHERYDGTGYPNGLKGEEIPLLSRIISIVDSFDVITHKRIYKDAFSIEYAIEELKRYSGTQFDPDIVNEFIGLL